MLPDGSRYVRATDPARAWAREDHRAADVVDAVQLLCWGMGVYDRKRVPEPPHVTRPAEMESMRRARERSSEAARSSRSARDVIEGTEWEEA